MCYWLRQAGRTVLWKGSDDMQSFCQTLMHSRTLTHIRIEACEDQAGVVGLQRGRLVGS